jgi:hypothetical protein
VVCDDSKEYKTHYFFFADLILFFVKGLATAVTITFDWESYRYYFYFYARFFLKQLSTMKSFWKRITEILRKSLQQRRQREEMDVNEGNSGQEREEGVSPSSPFRRDRISSSRRRREIIRDDNEEDEAEESTVPTSEHPSEDYQCSLCDLPFPQVCFPNRLFLFSSLLKYNFLSSL